MLCMLRPYRPLWTTSICDRVSITKTISSSSSSTGGISRLLNIAHQHLPSVLPSLPTFSWALVAAGTCYRWRHLLTGGGAGCNGASVSLRWLLAGPPTGGSVLHNTTVVNRPRTHILYIVPFPLHNRSVCYPRQRSGLCDRYCLCVYVCVCLYKNSQVITNETRGWICVNFSGSIDSGTFSDLRPSPRLQDFSLRSSILSQS